MPTFRSTDRRVQITGGQNVNMHTGNSGTHVSYRGSISLNGQPLSSPRQLRREWTDAGLLFLEEADTTDGVIGQEQRHYRARAKTICYGTAVDLMDKIGTDDLAQLAQAMRLTAQEVRSQIAAKRAEMTDVQFEAAESGAQGLEALAGQVDVAASVTWIEQ